MSDLVLYDKHGAPVVYCADGEHLWAFDGRPAGFMHDGSIYTYHGVHLGFLVDGWVRDHQGHAAFVTGEAGLVGPKKPFLSRTPARGIKQAAPMKGARARAPFLPKPTYSWSHRSSLFFFSPRSLAPPPEESEGSEGSEEGAASAASEVEAPHVFDGGGMGVELELDLGDEGSELELELDLDDL